MIEVKDLETVLGIIGGMAAAVAAYIAGRLHLRPLRLNIGYWEVLGQGRQMVAGVVNRTKTAQYMVKCSTRGVHPWTHVVFRIVRERIFRPRFWPTLRYGVFSYEMISAEPMKLEPLQPVSLKRWLPPNNEIGGWFPTPLMQLEVRLSDGRTFRSKAIRVPQSWRHPKLRQSSTQEKATE